jgi:hypothetical protein
VIETRTCKTCDTTKPLIAFTKAKRYKGDRLPHCNTCRSAKQLAWYATEPGRYARQQRENNLKRHYGITIDEYEAIFAAQGHRCALCLGTEIKSQGNHMPVDHCHETGKVRGILCGTCNRAIGFAQEDPDLLDRMAAYVREHSARG